MGERPVIDERREYVPRARQEEWIVPLLRRAILAALDQHGSFGAGRVALDAGCGGQPLRGEIEKHGWKYVSLDVVAAPGVTPDFLGALDGEIPQGCRDRGPYGLIVCTEVLEHVADWRVAWANLASLLAPEGVLIVTCPFVYPLHEEPFDFWRPTTHAIEVWSRKFGLEVVEAMQIGEGWDVLGTVAGAIRPEKVRGGIVSTLLVRIVKWLRKVVFGLCGSAWVRRHVKLAGPVYLSNVAVLRKRAQG